MYTIYLYMYIYISRLLATNSMLSSPSDNNYVVKPQDNIYTFNTMYMYLRLYIVIDFSMQYELGHIN